jgi:putative phosphoribosyl transferase
MFMATGKIRIISYSSEPFRNRVQAGQLLAREMSDYQGRNSIVLGIPRGGILVAASLAQVLEGELDIILSRKLGTPYQPELALGALAETGELFLNRYVVEELSIPDTYIEQEKARQMEEIRRRSRLIRSVRPRVVLRDRIVIVTDDGIATGATMQAAAWAIRHEKPEKLIVAVPVASEEAVNRLAPDVDEVICLRMPANFMAVGQFYSEFTQVTDEEVVDILRKSMGEENLPQPERKR